MLYCQLTRKMSTVGLFVLRTWKRPGLHARSLLRSAQHSGRLATRGSGSGFDDGWTLDSTTRGGWQGWRAMQVMFVLGLEFTLSKSDDQGPLEITRIDLQDERDLRWVCCCARPLREQHWKARWPTSRTP